MQPQPILVLSDSENNDKLYFLGFTTKAFWQRCCLWPRWTDHGGVGRKTGQWPNATSLNERKRNRERPDNGQLIYSPGQLFISLFISPVKLNSMNPDLTLLHILRVVTVSLQYLAGKKSAWRWDMIWGEGRSKRRERGEIERERGETWIWEERGLEEWEAQRWEKGAERASVN